MTPEELAPIVTAHQVVLSRHDAEMAEIRLILNQVAQQQQATARQQEINAQQIALNREDIAELKASITELRNIVADYIQGRSQT